MAADFDGSFAAVARAAGGSAVALVEALAGRVCFADVSSYRGRHVPFLKRASSRPRTSITQASRTSETSHA